jgi:hypothetical protein
MTASGRIAVTVVLVRTVTPRRYKSAGPPPTIQTLVCRLLIILSPVAGVKHAGALCALACIAPGSTIGHRQDPS